MRLIIDRHTRIAGGMFGDLLVDGEYLCHSLDPCVLPDGEYLLLPYNSPEHGLTVCFHNPALGIWAGFGQYAKTGAGHDFIEIHAGNWLIDSKACLLVGEEIEMQMWCWKTKSRMPGLEFSGDALAALRRRWGDRSNLTALVATRP